MIIEPFMITYISIVNGLYTSPTFRSWKDVILHVQELKKQGIAYRVYSSAFGLRSEIMGHSDLQSI